MTDDNACHCRRYDANFLHAVNMSAAATLGDYCISSSSDDELDETALVPPHCQVSEAKVMIYLHLN